MILDELAEYANIRVEADKKISSLEAMKNRALGMEIGEFRFRKALENDYPALICEVKKASPSKGIISEEFPFLEVAKSYEKSGATCISVLTEPKWFLGSDEIFNEIRQNVSLPMLRKDFTVDEYQIYQAKVMGADCVLLIVAILSLEEIKKYLEICEKLGLDALVEAHDEGEIAIAIEAGARIIGVNNRNLKNFSVDLDNASNLYKYIPKDVIFVAESGILTPNDGINLVKNGANAILIGEALMKADDKKAFIDEIKGAKYE